MIAIAAALSDLPNNKDEDQPSAATKSGTTRTYRAPLLQWKMTRCEGLGLANPYRFLNASADS